MKASSLLKKAVTFSLSLALTPMILGCSNSGVSQIKLESDFPDGKVYEFSDQEIDFPIGYGASSSGTLLSYDVTYQVISSSGAKTESDFPSFVLGVGSYDFIYSCSGVSLSRSFEVKDTTNPTISFTNVPASLFYEEGMSEQFLPDFSVNDLSWGDTSKVDEALFFTGKDGARKEISYNLMNRSYPVTGYGLYEYEVTATDDYGNHKTRTAKWRAKDYSYVAPSCEDGVLSDFSTDGYLNYIKAGDVNPNYSIGNDFTNDYLDSYEGAKGVVKIQLGFKDSGGFGSYTSISIKLAHPFSYDEMENKYLSVRAYVEGDNLTDSFGFAGNQKSYRDDGVNRCLTQNVSGLSKGAWKNYYIGQDAVEYMEMSVSSSSQEIEAIQLYFAATSASQKMTIYLDNISLASKLDSPALSQQSGILSWPSVEGAEGYSVNANGLSSTQSSSSFTLPSGEGYVKVKALGNSSTWLDSDETTTVYGLSLSGDQVASFDSSLYQYLFNDDLYFLAATDDAGYVPTYTSFRQSEEGLVSEIGQSGWGICTGIRFQFPNSLDLSNIDYLSLTLKISDTSYNLLRIFDYSHKTLLHSYSFSTDDQGKFVTLKIDLSDYAYSTLEGLHFIFNGTASAKVVVTFQSLLGLANLVTGVSGSSLSSLSISAIPSLFSGSGSLDASKMKLKLEGSEASASWSYEAASSTLNCALSQPATEKTTLTIEAGSSLSLNGESRTFGDDVSFIYIGGAWRLFEGNYALTASYTAPTLIQFTNFYSFDVPADNTELGFEGVVKLDSVEASGYQFIAYTSGPTTICLNNLSHEGHQVTIEEGSYLYYEDRAVKTGGFSGTWNGSSWN